MAELTERTKPAAGKPARAVQKTPFAGRKALISTMLEEMGDKGQYVPSSYDTLLVSGRSDDRAERELSGILGASVSIVTERELKNFVGQDEADRFISGVKAKKKDRR